MKIKKLIAAAITTTLYVALINCAYAASPLMTVFNLSKEPISIRPVMDKSYVGKLEYSVNKGGFVPVGLGIIEHGQQAPVTLVATEEDTKTRSTDVYVNLMDFHNHQCIVHMYKYYSNTYDYPNVNLQSDCLGSGFIQDKYGNLDYCAPGQKTPAPCALVNPSSK